MKISSRAIRTGFTLVEMLIVIVILGVLAGLAVPSYSPNLERSRSREALEHLQITRGAMLRYFLENGVYNGATIPLFATGTLDYNPNIRVGGQTVLFRYDFSSGPNAGDYVLRATRVGAMCGALPLAGSIRIDQAGTITRTGIYA